MQNPQHIAIIMDGNGRWAKKRFLPRIAGHVKGTIALKNIIKHCDKLNIKYLTVFAFGRENWNRPPDEVSFLMKLLSNKLDKEFNELNSKNVIIKFIGDKTRINSALAQKMLLAESNTRNNTGLTLTFSIDYSGTYDIVQAVNKIINEQIKSPITEEIFNYYLQTGTIIPPDLLIRTSGEMRISNFMLWQLAYTEMYFTDTLWPDFDYKELNKAINWYQSRERRFGHISEQI